MKIPCPQTTVSFISFILSAAVTSIALGQFSPVSVPQRQVFVESQTAPQPSVRTISTALTGFGVPFQINNSDNRFIEVQLYYSKDQGGSWQYHGRKSPDETEFPFHTQGDGEYWFALKTLDRDRKLHPDGNPQPELKVIVDTRKPELEFAAKSDSAGRIVCKWKALDRNINPQSMSISYRDATDPTNKWVPIEYKPNQVSNGVTFADQLAWWPKTQAQSVIVKMQIADHAGNEVTDERQVNIPQVGFPIASNSTATQGQPNCVGGVCRGPQPAAPNQVATRHLFGMGPQNRNGNVGSPPEFADPPAPIPTRDSITASAEKEINLDPNKQITNDDGVKSIEWQSQSQANPAEQKQFVNTTKSPAGRAGETPWPKVDTNLRDEQVVGTGTTHRPGFAPNQFVQPTTDVQKQDSSMAPIAPQRDQVTSTNPMKMVSAPKSIADNPLPELENENRDLKFNSINSRRFQLDYNVHAIDPSGVGKVVLWVTTDGGVSWKAWSTDNDNQSPFPVQMEQDGNYGFRVVIHSNDGISGHPPSSGDDADMWVRIDTTAPEAKITSVPYGTDHEAGRLVINWEASDEELVSKPVSLSYSTNEKGPWTTIEKGIRNTGRYVWKVDRRIPDQLFLRLEVTDVAGNTTVKQLTRPIDVSGLVPRGRINGVKAVR